MEDRRSLRQPSRLRRIVQVAAIAAAVALLATACSLAQTARINSLRTAAGLPKLPDAPLLDTAATAHANAMCAAGAVSPAPAGSYNQESATAVREFVGAAAGDPTLDATDRDAGAMNTIWDQWSSDPTWMDQKWTSMGMGESHCADGKLYMVAVLRQAPSMPTSGMYSTPQYDASQVQTFSGLQFSSAPDANGVVQPLLLDLMKPPNATAATPQPVVIEVHGGAFVGGNRTDSDGEVMEWARRGYVGVTIDYRLTKVDANGGVDQIAAATAATPDVQNSVRWLRANAATYGIDPNRVAMVGNSAGAALTLAAAVSGTATTTGPLAAYSPVLQAAVGTGAYLTPALPFLTFNANEAPVQMYQYDMDEATHVTAAYAFETCDALRAAGSTCDEIQEPGTGHTAWLVPGGPEWQNRLGPFIWNHLHLSS
jgi:acetyl esterase/lipase